MILLHYVDLPSHYSARCWSEHIAKELHQVHDARVLWVIEIKLRNYRIHGCQLRRSERSESFNLTAAFTKMMFSSKSKRSVRDFPMTVEICTLSVISIAFIVIWSALRVYLRDIIHALLTKLCETEGSRKLIPFTVTYCYRDRSSALLLDLREQYHIRTTRHVSFLTILHPVPVRDERRPSGNWQHVSGYVIRRKSLTPVLIENAHDAVFLDHTHEFSTRWRPARKSETCFHWWQTRKIRDSSRWSSLESRWLLEIKWIDERKSDGHGRLREFDTRGLLLIQYWQNNFSYGRDDTFTT